MIPVINKPSKIIRKSATAIDDILMNAFVHQASKLLILKYDISNHFPIFFFHTKHMKKKLVIVIYLNEL